MREIKFRAWDEENKIMIKNYAHIGGNGRLYVAEGSEPIRELKLLEYTGLKDKNDKEIFEGNLIKFDGYDAIFKVAFESAGFVVHWVFGEAGVPFGGSLSNCDFQRTFTNGSFNFEVIGNIYENKNLIDN